MREIQDECSFSPIKSKHRLRWRNRLLFYFSRILSKLCMAVAEITLWSIFDFVIKTAQRSELIIRQRSGSSWINEAQFVFHLYVIDFWNLLGLWRRKKAVLFHTWFHIRDFRPRIIIWLKISANAFFGCLMEVKTSSNLKKPTYV